ncbi:MAG TPA: hypothetical protein VM936_00320 [Pyrinomonadaceae bacterium]|jgi:hypothetical protein|nr:hypothetical protein [Pyrinomonadaceae bacterium]
MAINDIPEYVEVAPGDLIRAENWNRVQQQMRDSLRRHKHTRAPNQQPNDAGLSDDAAQIGTAEIADGAVTAAKLAPGTLSNVTPADGSVTATKLADNAVGTPKISDGAITTEKISPNAINASRLAFSFVVNTTGDTLGPGSTKDITVDTVAANQKSGIYFPVLTIVSVTGVGTAIVSAQIIFKRGNSDTSFFVTLRLSNTGNATAGIFYQVLTFAH